MFKSVKDQIWFFDCEWLPDPQAGRLLYHLPATMSDADVLAEMWRHGGATEENPQPFLKTNFSRIVSVAALMRKVTPAAQVAAGEPKVKLHLIWLPRDVQNPENCMEASVVGTFLNAVGKFHPQLVGYNSRSSGLKILFQRAFVKGIVAKEFCKRPDKPWEGIDYFSDKSDWNVDLFDSIANWSGRGTAPSLHEIAMLAGIPGLMGVSGEDVAKMWLEGKWKEIVEYNCFDAISVYLVWLRMAHLGGFVTDEDYEEEQGLLADMLMEEAEKPEMAFLNRYLDEWEHLKEVTGQ